MFMPPAVGYGYFWNHPICVISATVLQCILIRKTEKNEVFHADFKMVINKPELKQAFFGNNCCNLTASIDH